MNIFNWPIQDGAFCGSFLLFYVPYRSCFLSVPPGHLLGKDWPLESLMCDVFLYFCQIPMLWSGSDVVLI